VTAAAANGACRLAAAIVGRMERKWWTLIAVSVGIFMLLMDITIVNVALPDIQRELHASFDELQWVVNAYALSLAALLLTAGSIADLLGRRRLFAIGLVIFTVASLTCGLSSGATMLNVARAVQGIGGATMLATSLALIASAFHGRDRGVAFGVYGAVIGAAVAVGPVVGGALTSGIGWEWIFFVNVPIGLVALAIALTQVEESRDPHARRIDWLGLLTFSGGLFLLVYGLTQANDAGWGSAKIVGCLGGAALLLVLFVVVERLQERPMLDLGLLRVPAFAGVSLVTFAVAASMFAMFLFLTLYIQDVLGYDPLQAGLRFLPISLLSFVVAPFAGRLTVRVPVRLLLSGGLALVAAGLALMSTVDAGSDWTVLLPGFLLAGVGIGLANPAIASTAVGVVPHTRAGMASGFNNTCRQVGLATGIAALGAVFQHALTSHLNGASSGANALGARPAGPADHAFRVAFAGALHDILLVGAAVALAGALAGLALVRQRDFVAAHAPAAAPAPEAA
jgi:EmrB/QacA subfamily drug resistance transporter